MFVICLARYLTLSRKSLFQMRRLLSGERELADSIDLMEKCLVQTDSDFINSLIQEHRNGIVKVFGGLDDEKQCI